MRKYLVADVEQEHCQIVEADLTESAGHRYIEDCQLDSDVKLIIIPIAHCDELRFSTPEGWSVRIVRAATDKRNE